MWELVELLNLLPIRQVFLNPAFIYVQTDVKCFPPGYSCHILVAAAGVLTGTQVPVYSLTFNTVLFKL